MNDGHIRDWRKAARVDLTKEQVRSTVERDLAASSETTIVKSPEGEFFSPINF
jgi:hypothetical protein